LAKERVKNRVLEGGHNIESQVIERRYYTGIKNLFDIYLPIVDMALIYDNSAIKHILIAEKSLNDDVQIVNNPLFDKILEKYDHAKKK